MNLTRNIGQLVSFLLLGTLALPLLAKPAPVVNLTEQSLIWDSFDSYIAYTYDQGARLKQKWMANGVTTEFDHYSDNTLKQLKNSSYNFNTYVYTNFTQHDFGYDNLGRRFQSIDKVGNFTQPPGTQAFSYDPLGNRLSKTDNSVLTTYLSDSANQLKEIHAGPIAGALITAQVFDDAGNMTRKCQSSFSAPVTTSGAGASATCSGTDILSLQYNADNKLTQATKSNASAATSESYGYDHEGRRVRKTSTDSNGNQQTTWYVYNGQDIVAEYEGNWAKPKAITTHGPNTDDPVVRFSRNSSNTGYDKRYYHQDGLGSSVAVTDEAGTVVATQLFDVWGNKQPNASLGQVERYGFTGREPDATGLIYYRARYYDPATARFTQRDPIGLEGGINQYAYVGNDPVNFTDPSGTQRQSPVGIVGDGYSGCNSAAELDPGVMTDFAETRDSIDLSTGEVNVAFLLCMGQASAAAAGGLGAGAPGYQGMSNPAGNSGVPGRAMDDARPGSNMTTSPADLGGQLLALPGKLIASLPPLAIPGLISGLAVSATDLIMSSVNGNIPTLESNPKHHPNSVSPEPSSVDRLYDNSVVDSKGVRWAKDESGELNRFSKPSNGKTHWNGTTDPNTIDPIKPQNIPNEIKKLLGYK